MGRRLFVDGDKLQFVESASSRIPLDRLKFRYDTFEELDFIFVRAGVPYELPASTTLKLVIKREGVFDGDPLAGIPVEGFSLIGSGENAVYRGYLDTTAEEIEAALEIDEDEENDVPLVRCQAELVITTDGKKSRTEIIETIISNSLGRDDDEIPSTVPPSNLFVTVAALRPGWKEVAGTTYTLLEADHDLTLRFTNPAGCTVTAPVLFDGFRCGLRQDDLGKVSVDGDTGVTVDCPEPNRRTVKQFAGASIKYLGTSTVWLDGKVE